MVSWCVFFFFLKKSAIEAEPCVIPVGVASAASIETIQEAIDAKFGGSTSLQPLPFCRSQCSSQKVVSNCGLPLSQTSHAMCSRRCHFGCHSHPVCGCNTTALFAHCTISSRCSLGSVRCPCRISFSCAPVDHFHQRVSVRPQAGGVATNQVSYAFQ